jgi:AcrR family transcriptional regulator
MDRKERDFHHGPEEHMSISTDGKPRQKYHHGDLRQALLAAGMDLARDGGPDAVVLREATRRVGVSPNAAYRHFADRDALLDAVSDASMSALATAIDDRFQAIPTDDPESMVRAQLRAVGSGYVAFAQENPGLFRTAFFVPSDMEQAAKAAKAGPSGRTPFELLTDVLDGFVECGIMPPERRPNAEFLAWSSVHGLSILLIDGPLRALPRSKADEITQRVIDMVEAGFTA